MRARYYSPELRRFINADIIPGEISNAITLNRYAYANGNPVSNIDPFGLSADRLNFDLNKKNNNNPYSSGPLATRYKDLEELETLIKNGPYADLGYWERFLLWAENTSEELFDSCVNMFKEATKNGDLDLAILLVIGTYKDKDGIYHIFQRYWQSTAIIGYNDFYDYVFDKATRATGGTMETTNFKFTIADGTEYVLWLWKGDYINLGSGAELGIYKASKDIPNHYLTSTENSMPMTLSLKEIDSGEVLFEYNPSRKKWWITGFDASHQNARASNLEMTVTVDFSGRPELFEGFYKKYGNNAESPWTFDGKVAKLVW